MHQPQHCLNLKVNIRGRDFIAGDIHGHFEALEDLLELVDFDEINDRIFVTGDIIDRGPYSHHVINWLSRPWFYTVLGNHEKMVIDAINGKGDPGRHSRNGGAWFYERTTIEQREIAEKLLKLPIAIELHLHNEKKAGIIHAEPPGWQYGLSWEQGINLLLSEDELVRQAAVTQALYSRNRISNKITSEITGIDSIYVGHTTVPDVVQIGNTIYLDTGCSFPDGHLTLIDMHTGVGYTSRGAKQLI